MIDVVWLSVKEDVPNRGMWDQAFVEDLIQDTFHEVKHHDSTHGLEGAIVVIPCRNQADRVNEIVHELSHLAWCVVILTGDEEGVFPIEAMTHPNMKVWVMSPQQGRHDGYRKLGSGYNPFLRKTVQYNDKLTNWFFSGQINHERREMCRKALLSIQKDIPGEYNGTDGFTQGMSPEEYSIRLSQAKVAPCPSGIQTPDTFRLFEALECGCIPIADEFAGAKKTEPGYWTWFFGEAPPFVRLTTYEGLKDYIVESLDGWKNKANHVFAWWQTYKYKMRQWLIEDVKTVSSKDYTQNITVLMPTSVIPSHPSTDVIDQCIKDVRAKLPNSDIIIMFDGLNPHFEDRRGKYEEYIRRVLWKANFEWKNVVPLIFDKPTHQVGMTRKALEYVKSPTILYVEHDCPICSDIEFGYSWDELVKTILEGQANVVRFHHEAQILPSSQELLLGSVEKVNGVPMIRTAQWSQRPHLARTQFYKEMLEHYFAPDAFGMIEDHIYGIVVGACKDNMMGWHSWKLWIFHPEGGNIKRSYTLDGRQEDPKLDEEFKY